VRGLPSDGELVCEQAHRDARADIDAGQPSYYGFGLLSPCWHDYVRAVYEKLGVVVVNLGCVVDEVGAKYAGCYDELVEAHVDTEHGPGAMGEVWMRACMR
jgi:hypothetical protein